MRSIDLTPLYRSTVGFDRIAAMLDSVMDHDMSAPAYPPYNIEKTGEDAYRITVAVAGFTEDELSVESREGRLVIAGRKQPPEDGSTGNRGQQSVGFLQIGGVDIVIDVQHSGFSF